MPRAWAANTLYQAPVKSDGDTNKLGEFNYEVQL
jgi:hypothetical protein